MPVFSGNTSGSIASIAYNIPSTIKSYSLTNRTGGSVTANLVIIPNGGSPVYVWSGSIATGESQTSDIPIKLLVGYQILIIVSGSTDYYFNI
jgi:hypothetical protein